MEENAGTIGNCDIALCYIKDTAHHTGQQGYAAKVWHPLDLRRYLFILWLNNSVTLPDDGNLCTRTRHRFV